MEYSYFAIDSEGRNKLSDFLENVYAMKSLPWLSKIHSWHCMYAMAGR